MDRRIRDLIYLIRFIKPFSKYFPIFYVVALASDFIIPKYKSRVAKINNSRHDIFDGNSSEDLKEATFEKDYHNYWSR